MAVLNFNIEEAMGIKDGSDTRTYLDHWSVRLVAWTLSGLGCRHMYTNMQLYASPHLTHNFLLSFR